MLPDHENTLGRIMLLLTVFREFQLENKMKLVGGILIGPLCKFMVRRAGGCRKKILSHSRINSCKCYERKKHAAQEELVGRDIE